MTIQYASLEDAWGGASSTPQYPVNDEFAVAKNDSLHHRAYTDTLENDVTMALESAYPTNAAAQRIPRVSDTPPAYHRPNDTPCDSEARLADYAPQYDAPAIASSSGPVAPSVDRIARAHHAPSHGGDATRPASVERSMDVHHQQTELERAAMYDILLFVLFGLLMVLTLHEAASIGEVIGRHARI